VREQKKMAFVDQRKKAKMSQKLHKETQDTKRNALNAEKQVFIRSFSSRYTNICVYDFFIMFIVVTICRDHHYFAY
jgi:hypothetical protein